MIFLDFESIAVLISGIPTALHLETKEDRRPAAPPRPGTAGTPIGVGA